MNKADPYGTHLDLLRAIFKFTGKQKNVVEFGMGNFSTELLLENSTNLISIEMQSEDWYEKMFEKFKNKPNWRSLKLIGPLQFMSCDFKNTNLAFVDGHGESRPECVNLMFNNNVPVVIAHDTEMGSYGWSRVKELPDYKKFIFKKHENWTTVWTTNIALCEHLEQCLQ
jgi:prepilin-type processing-associated H-X9-DG protein